eukprot:m51a1_g4044 hypothetical protein (221) ;mRNA; f:687126-687932
MSAPPPGVQATSSSAAAAAMMHHYQQQLQQQQQQLQQQQMVQAQQAVIAQAAKPTLKLIDGALADLHDNISKVLEHASASVHQPPSPRPQAEARIMEDLAKSINAVEMLIDRITLHYELYKQRFKVSEYDEVLRYAEMISERRKIIDDFAAALNVPAQPPVVAPPPPPPPAAATPPVPAAMPAQQSQGSVVGGPDLSPSLAGDWMAGLLGSSDISFPGFQ